MSNSDTKWTSDGRTIPDIEPHTKTKHLLTEQYVKDLIHTLYAKTRYGLFLVKVEKKENYLKHCLKLKDTLILNR